jgi:competence protein ComEC
MAITLLVAAWLAGLLIGFRFGLVSWPVFLLALAMMPLGLLLYLLRRSPWPAVLAGVLLLGLWRVEITQSAEMPLVAEDSQQVSIKGRIVSDPEAAAQRIKFVLDVKEVDRGDGWQPLPSNALVYADPPEPLVSVREPPYFRYSDALTLQGTLQRPEPFEGFDYPSYLANQGIDGVFWSRQAEWLPQEGDSGWRGWVFDLRRRLSESLEAALPLPHSVLAQALLLDVRGGLPDQVIEEFRNTGTLHLIAISGLQVGVLLIMTIGASSGLMGKRRQVYLLLPLLAIWAYALVSGVPVSVVRAAIMGTTYLAAISLGRPQSALAPLSFSAALITAIDPWALLQIPFQLSFAGVAGMVLALPYQAKVAASIRGGIRPDSPWWELWLRHFLNWIATGMIVSLAATLATLPVVAFNFHQIPLFGIPLTILALPAMPFMLAGSLATALVGLIHPWLGQFFGWLTWVPLSYFLGLVSVAPGQPYPAHGLALR